MNNKSLVTYKCSGDEDSSTDSTDYEPEPKKYKLEEDKNFAGGSGGSSSSNDPKLEKISDTDTHTNHDSNDKPTVDLENGSDPDPVTPSDGFEGPRRHVQVTLPQGQRNFHQSCERTRSNNSSDTSSFLSDDMDPLEIPSDEYLSPPSPLPNRYRQRRNAIFEQRGPPPSAQVVNEDDQFYQNEFEVASVSDINENPIEDANSTSAADDDEGFTQDDTKEYDKIGLKQIEETDANFADEEGEKLQSDGDTDETYQSSSRSKGLNSSDSELSDKDKWFCSQCNAKSQPYFRYCLRCFKIRRNWLPKRPVSRRLKRRKAAQRVVSSQSVNTISSDASGEDTVDSRVAQSSQVASPLDPNNEQGILPCSSLQSRELLSSIQTENLDQNFLRLANFAETMASTKRRERQGTPQELSSSSLFASPSNSLSKNKSSGFGTCGTDANDTTSLITSLNSQGLTQSSTTTQCNNGFSHSHQHQTPLGTSAPAIITKSLSPATELKKNDGIMSTTKAALCTICYVREKDSAFVHNKIAHQYCCYACADKILKKDGRCPICRGRVLRVVKIISV